jgi:pimeloyl-ACP methyl ester carboxylesterase
MASTAIADPFLAAFQYPHPVQRYEFRSQNETLWMSYLDIAAEKPNGRTIVLLHGKNFCGATWEGVIPSLTGAGYRVLIPDQIGFCRSAKPAAYQTSLHQLAANTHRLLVSLGIERPIILGHSMGGMRYALQFPGDTSALVLVNPIGLEDWTAKGVPRATVDQLYAKEPKTDASTIRAYHSDYGRSRHEAASAAPEHPRWALRRP